MNLETISFIRRIISSYFGTEIDQQPPTIRKMAVKSLLPLVKFFIDVTCVDQNRAKVVWTSFCIQQQGFV